ncbi:hypothetical protein [Absidia glauca]|uniref:Uncharacterized protein n=1 Tax=Absidia glauca TaxID=4829 RepID=A0A163KS50_ABSGL|nr:hypothetical protein [Absidia glauca]
MISLTQTWYKFTQQLRRKRSLQSHESSKSVRFYHVDTVFYTHSSIEYDRTPSAELSEEDYLDDESDDDDDDDTLPPSPSSSIFTHSSFLPATATTTCFDEKVLVFDDHSPAWEKPLTSPV